MWLIHLSNILFITVLIVFNYSYFIDVTYDDTKSNLNLKQLFGGRMGIRRSIEAIDNAVGKGSTDHFLSMPLMLNK